MAASMIPSPSVGWAWMVSAMSARVASRCMASTPSGIRSLAPGPMTWTPSTSPSRRPATTLTSPSVDP
jgi:hypothetical protein